MRRRLRRAIRKRIERQSAVARRSQKHPQLSVVVAVHNDGRYLEECLRSLLSQSLTRLEVIAVDAGSTDGSLHILRQFAALDQRVKVVSLAGNGLAAARNAGIQHARGKFLTFVNAQDTVPRNSFAIMVQTLRRSGSDFVVGAVQRVRNGRSMRPQWVVNVHQLDRISTSIDEFPAAMQDLAIFNRVFRTAFWHEQVGPFAEDSEHKDLLNTVTAYLRAASFDVLTAATYRWHRRSDHASIVQERYDRTTLDERLPILSSAWEAISTSTSEAVAGAWLGGVLDTDLGAYLEHATTGDDAYRAALQAIARHFFDLATPIAWEHVRVDRRLRLWLAVQGRWSVLEQCIEFFRLNGLIPSTRVSGGRITADIPFAEALGDDTPDICFELASSQTALSACVERAFWDDSGCLVVEGWAFIRGVDLTDTTPELEATLVEPVSGSHLCVPLEPLVLPEATRWANQPNQNYDTSGFRLRIDVSALPPIDPEAGVRRWSLQMRNRTHGVERTGPVRSVIRSAIAWRMRARDLTAADDPVRFVPLADSALGFGLQVRPDRIRAVHLSSGPGGRVSGKLRIVNPIAVPIVAVRATTDGAQVESPLLHHVDTSLGFDFTLPVGIRRSARWTFRAIGEDGRRYRVSWPDEATSARRVGGELGAVTWLRSPRGFCDLVTDRVALKAASVTLSDERVTVEFETAGLSLEEVRQTRLHSARAGVASSEVVQLDRDRYRVQFSARTDIWGISHLPLPAGTYSISIPDLRLWCGVTDALLEQCPIFGFTACHGFTVARTPGRDRLMLNIRAPLNDAERGRNAQRRLARWYQETEFEPRDAVLFQCYRGEFSTDSQRAIHEELFRRGSPLELLWAVSSYSVPLPEGALPLLIGSRAWYEAVGSARYLCQNIDYDRFFRKRSHQKYLQTFHGYPWKSMGVSLWRAQGKSESLITVECERRNSAWDSILVPAEFCAELYRREYRYPHEVLVTGYPRDDALVNGDRDAARANILNRLGIPADKTVVLYAPTWRDTVATGAWTAKLFDELDLNYLARQLGDDFALLLRGHNYNLREGSAGSSASVLDVSSYPEINDLILAADAAILDYSSLRFDWMLTGKPVLFFVPDLANYLSARTVLFEYGPTAPGPMLTTTEEVVEALLDLSSITTEYAAAREAFNLEFQTLHDGHATQRVVDRFFGADAWPENAHARPRDREKAG